MTQYNKLNVKLSNSQLNKLKSAITNEIEVTLNFSSNIIGDSNDENNFPHRLLLTNAQDSKFHKSFSDIFSANIEFSKIQWHKVIESGEFLGRLLETLLKTGFLLIENVLKPSAKNVSIPLGLTTAASATFIRKFSDLVLQH